MGIVPRFIVLSTLGFMQSSPVPNSFSILNLYMNKDAV